MNDRRHAVAQPAGAVIRVFEVAPGRASPPERVDQLGRAQSVAGLCVHGDRDVDAADDPGRSRQHLVAGRALVIFVPE
nr:hypothetical protein [Desertimonas flava]